MEARTLLNVKQVHLARLQETRIQVIEATEKFADARNSAQAAGCTNSEIALAISTAEGSTRR